MGIFAIEPYSDLEKFNQISREILFQISKDRKHLQELVLAVPKNESFFALCAHYEAVDKIVLWNSEDRKMQLRLHVYSDRNIRSTAASQINIADVHNHRWNFSSLVLSGGYYHTIYRVDNNKDDPPIRHLIPTMIRYESVGDCYTVL